MRFAELRARVVSIGRESWVLFLAITVANASNYVFHVFISRLMDPGDYGALNAVLAILIWLSIPLGAVQTTVAKRLAERRESGSGGVDDSWPTLLKTVAPVGLVLSGVLAIATPFLHGFLRLDSLWTGFFVALYVMPALLLTVCRGVLQGHLHFKQLALVSLFPVLGRLGAGIPIVSMGGGVAGAVAASVIAETAGVALAFWLLARNRDSAAGRGKRDWRLLREVVPVMTGLAAMWLLIELDIILARRLLPAGEAGVYAAAGVLARAVLFVPGAVSLVALPHFSRARGRGADAHRWLLSSVTMVVGLGVAAAIALAVAGDFVVQLTFGSDYAASADYLSVLSFAMVGMGLANLMVFFHIAAGSRMFQLLWLVAALEVLAIMMLPASGHMLAAVVAITAWVTAAIGFLAARSVSLSPTLLADFPREAIVLDQQDPPSHDQPELSLVIPSYNGGPRLAETVRNTLKAIHTVGRTYEVIVVSDGSTDNSAQSAAELVGSVDVVHYTRRHGKGVALRVGMTRARGRYVAFVDGDGDLDVGELKSFLALMDMYRPDMVIGSKRHPLSRVEYPRSRRAMSWIYQRIVRILFGLNVRDTQTGMKLVRRDVLDAVLPRMLEKRFAFDLEFLVVARRLGYRRIFEAPVTLNYRFESTVSPQAVFRILLDTAAIYYRRYILRFYDYPVPERPAGSPAYPAQLASLVERAAGP